jgi:YggT family protein
MSALIFVLDALFTLVLIAFLLRVLLPLVDAGFRNPIGQAVLKVTDPIVLPLRRVFKPAGRVDIAAIVALVLVQLVATALLLGIAGASPLALPILLVRALLSLLDLVLQFYTVCLLIYVVLSWVAPDVRNPAIQLLLRICEPVLAPVRRVLPPLGGLDLSPLLVLIALQAVRILLRGF